jgi:pimeloyl-ACP methyl ester carboxylesterase
MSNLYYRLPVMIATFILFCSCTIFAQDSADGEMISINNFQMYYEIGGDGPPLVLFHGFGGSGKFWDRHSADLMKHYRLIIPDLRGHGRSTNPINQFTHQQSALDVFELLNNLKIDQFKAMGYSTGGMTLIHMATQQPDRVEAMVLIGATSYFPDQAREIMRQTSQIVSLRRKWKN